jgi:hypothetical protein
MKLVSSLALLTFASLGVGCVAQADDAERFREGIPQSGEVAIAVPRGSGGATTKSLGTKGGADTTTSSAKYYQFSRDLADGLDWGTAQILGLVWIIVHQPPTKVEPKKATWGPGGDALDPITWRFVATEIGDREYNYVLEGRPKASTRDADWKAILSGHGYGKTHKLHREGWFAIDNDAKNAMDPARAKDKGTVKVDFDLKTYPTKIHAYAQATPDKSKGWFDVTLTRESSGSGNLDISALGDMEEEGKKDGNLETITLFSQWANTGAGRADVRITGGSLPATITNVEASECWSTSFSRVYYVDSVGAEPTSGDPSTCTFAAKSF